MQTATITLPIEELVNTWDRQRSSEELQLFIEARIAQAALSAENLDF